MSETPKDSVTTAQAVAAEVRARLAVNRITLRQLAAGAGFASHNYVAVRLRDEKPFTLDDLDRISAYLETTTFDLVRESVDRYRTRVLR